MSAKIILGLQEVLYEKHPFFLLKVLKKLKVNKQYIWGPKRPIFNDSCRVPFIVFHPDP